MRSANYYRPSSDFRLTFAGERVNMGPRIRGASPLVDCLRGYSPVTRPSNSPKEYPRQCIHAFGAKSINQVLAGYGPLAWTMTDTGDSLLAERAKKPTESLTFFASVRYPKDSLSTISAETEDVLGRTIWNLCPHARTLCVAWGQVLFAMLERSANGVTHTPQKTRTSTRTAIACAGLAGESTEENGVCEIQVYPPLRRTRCENEGYGHSRAAHGRGSCSKLGCLWGVRRHKKCAKSVYAARGIRTCGWCSQFCATRASVPQAAQPLACLFRAARVSGGVSLGHATSTLPTCAAPTSQTCTSELDGNTSHRQTSSAMALRFSSLLRNQTNIQYGDPRLNPCRLVATAVRERSQVPQTSTPSNQVREVRGLP